MMKSDGEIYKNMCFVIMPIGEITGRPNDHFKHVYEDVFKEAIIETGFKPKRADDDKSSSMIQVDIIRDIVNAPMAICDLSTRNPNVLFELGIRQAFDLPVVLVQEEGTPRIFDISTINTIEYRKERIYHEVLDDRKKIVSAINATRDNKKGINSIIKLLEIGKAKLDNADGLSDFDEIKLLLYSLTNEINKSRSETSAASLLRKITSESAINKNEMTEVELYYDRLVRYLETKINTNDYEVTEKDCILNDIKKIQTEISNIDISELIKVKFISRLDILQKTL